MTAEDPEQDSRSKGSPSHLERRVIQVSDLLQGAQEVLLQHGTEFYLLRITRNGRLLLTK